MSQSTCAGCGRKIIWAKTKNDKNVPIEEVPVIELRQEEGRQPIAESTSAKVYVNHFMTCPKANEFSGRNRT